MSSHDRNEGTSSTSINQHRMAAAMSSGSNAAAAADPFFGSGWDPLGYTNPHHAYPVSMEAQGMSSSTSHLVQYPSYGSGSFSDMVGPFGGLSECAGISNPGCVGNYNTPNNDDQQVSEEGGLGSSGKRRKRVTESSPNKNAEGEFNKEMSGGSSEFVKEQDEKKAKVEENAGANSRGKQNAGKQAKETSQSGGDGKDSYIHMRARRGQATNSHSLAERVRREKISERMRLLQELVPGCNKITGKAVMLDEIINYVQSLQQQVEFLSMKLATVNPEVNIGIDRILSKDIMNSRNSSGAFFGFNPAMNSPHPYSHSMFQGTLPNMSSAAPQFSSMPRTVMDNELQGLFHMGFDPSSNIDSLGQNASRLKPEL